MCQDGLVWVFSPYNFFLDTDIVAASKVDINKGVGCLPKVSIKVDERNFMLLSAYFSSRNITWNLMQ